MSDSASNNITFNGDGFSDGSSLSYHAPSYVAVYDSNSQEKYFSEQYRNALFSNESITIHAKAGPFSEDIVIQSPVTAGSIIDALNNFFSTEITNAQYQMLQDTKFFDSWNPSMFPTMEVIKEHLTMYGHLNGDHRYFEGLRRQGGNYYSIRWGS
jgi:hypothetical protein